MSEHEFIHFWRHERPFSYRFSLLVCWLLGCDKQPGGDCRRCWG